MTSSIVRLRVAAHKLITTESTFLVGTNFIGLFARLASSVIITRLLDASAFGTVSIISTFSFMIVMLTDFGFYQYTVKSSRIDDDSFLDKVWTVRLSRDLIISLIFITLSGVMANYVRDPTLQLAFAVTSITLITEGLSSMAFATATRTGMVNRLALLDLIPILITILVSIGLALVFKNYWALVISGTFGSILKMWLSYSMFPHSGRRLRFDKSIFLDIWNFGRFIVPSSIIALLIGQGDKFILVRFLTLHQLGLYSLASALSSAPSALMNSYSNRILYPAFSDPQLSTSARSYVFYSLGLKTRLAFIFLFCMFITSAPAVIGILYDDRYFPAAQFLSILLVAGIINFVIDTETDMMVAIGRVRWQLYVNIIRLLVYALSSFTLYKVFGVIGVVWAIAFTAIVMKAVTSSVMWYLGIARIKEEMKFLLVAIMGAAVGMSITVSGKAFWSSMPLPFFSS